MQFFTMPTAAFCWRPLNTFTYVLILVLSLPNSAYCIHYLLSLCGVCQCVCTTLFRTEFLMYIFLMWHIYAHTSARYAHQVLGI